MHLERALDSDKTIRSVGFDDAPFERDTNEPVGLAGIIAKDTHFDGMVWGEIDADGDDTNDAICALLEGGKFLPQLHAVLLDGIAYGGFNVVDLPNLAERLDRPCIAVMRNRPDFDAIRSALSNVDGGKRRLQTIRRAGAIHQSDEAFFQVRGCSPDVAARLLDRLTIHGNIPEPLRLAHLVASAVATGESGRRA